MDVEAQHYIQLVATDDSKHLLEEIHVRAKARRMHLDRIETLQQLTKLVVRYEKAIRCESMVVRSNFVTLVKWSGADDAGKLAFGW